MMTKKPAKKGMIPAGYANGGKAMKKEEGKGHAKKEMAALKKGGASKKVMMAEAKEYGMKMANGGKAFKPCAGCPMPKKCAAAGKCLKGGK
jgi:hypothetical protein